MFEKKYVRRLYGNGAGNTLEENSSIFSQSECASCHQQGRAGSKTLLQQNPPVINWGSRLMQVILYNDRKTLVVVSIYYTEET